MSFIKDFNMPRDYDKNSVLLKTIIDKSIIETQRIKNNKPLTDFKLNVQLTDFIKPIIKEFFKVDAVA
jgi:hypothetical protein